MFSFVTAKTVTLKDRCDLLAEGMIISANERLANREDGDCQRPAERRQ
jgi:hypothetical protein